MKEAYLCKLCKTTLVQYILIVANILASTYNHLPVVVNSSVNDAPLFCDIFVTHKRLLFLFYLPAYTSTRYSQTPIIALIPGFRVKFYIRF